MKLRVRFGWSPLLVAAALHCSEAAAADPEPAAPVAPAAELALETGAPNPVQAIAPGDWLVLPRVGDYSRAVLHADPVEGALARGEWQPPVSGQALAGAAWRADARDKPRDADLAGGYAYTSIETPREGVWLVEAPGVAAVWIGDPDQGGARGEWVVGDAYATGWFRAPIALGRGRHAVVAHLARPDGAVRFVPPAAPVALVTSEATLADAVVGSGDESLLGAIHVTNATAEDLVGLEVVAEVEGAERIVSVAPRVAALTVARLPFRYAVPKDAAPGTVELRVTLRAVDSSDAGKAKPLDDAALTLRVVAATSARTATHQSAIDGSVQPYTVVPTRSTAAGDPAEGAPLHVVLALHDAAESHADCAAEIGPLKGATVVAPGGRGRWGFDWEDWSARDAIEALDDYERRSASASGRAAVVGRGMGGHGALRLATLHPDRFAAAAVLSGWISFYTQGSATPAPPDEPAVVRMLGRAASAADPLRTLPNLARLGVWVEHSPADSAPLAESRLLRRRLGEFHGDFVYREGSSREASGWREFVLDRLAAKAAPSNAVDFSTHDPQASSRCGWVAIELPRRQGEVARVRLDRDPATRTVRGTTDNVARLVIDAAAIAGDGPVVVRLDGGAPIEATPRRDGALRFARNDEGVWRRTRRPAPEAKGPTRAGGLKRSFDALPLAVYGTRGSEAERQWAASKARYDAHLFLLRGAGSLEVLADVALIARARGADEPQRSVILYGNRSTNAAYDTLLRESPVAVEAGVVRVGPRPESGDALAAIFVRPSSRAERGSVALVGGTGPVGMRLTTRLRWCWAGVELPDLLLFGSHALDGPVNNDEPANSSPNSDPAAGRGADDVRAAGYFGPDWGVESGDIVWRDLAM
ncbi:MAG: alpha/beta hydrolase-fold protein [Lacipirellulaceae bacterium]